MTASRRSIGCDEPMEQHRGRAAAAMAKAAGQGGRSRHRCCALRAQSNIAARTPPASQNVLRVRPQANRGRNRTRAARDAARADLQSLEPNPIGPRKAPHKCPTATPTALHGPAALAGTRATAALASSRSERPTSSDGRAAAADDAVAKKTHTRGTAAHIGARPRGEGLPDHRCGSPSSKCIERPPLSETAVIRTKTRGASIYSVLLHRPKPTSPDYPRPSSCPALLAAPAPTSPSPTRTTLPTATATKNAPRRPRRSPPSARPAT